MNDPYLILKRGPDFAPADMQMPASLWCDLGEVVAAYAQEAVERVAAEHGEGEYMAIGGFGRPRRFAVTSRQVLDFEEILVKQAIEENEAA